MEAIAILAAGQGKRMVTSLPKVLNELCGKPLINYVIDACQKLNPAKIFIVTSPEINDYQGFKNYQTVLQSVPLGTGDALKQVLSKIDDKIEYLTVVCGDTPLLDHQELYQLINSNADLTVFGAKLKPENLHLPYGRIFLDEKNCPKEIVEMKDASDKQKSNNLINTGVIRFSLNTLKKIINKLNNNNNAKEFYLTDLIKIAYDQGYSTAFLQGDIENFTGINNLNELSKVENILQDRLKQNLMLKGVRLIMPDTIYLSSDIEIEKDVIIHPHVTFGKNVVIKKGSNILSFCHIEQSTIEQNSTIGPFAHLRNKVLISQNTQIGNFVEIKGSTIGSEVKIKHLSYIGDAEIGCGTNIGAGTITCNYDGFKKSKTKIGKDVMVGANSSLIAPLEIGDESYIAAGSVITKNVSQNSLAITRTPQQEKLGWIKNRK